VEEDSIRRLTVGTGALGRPVECALFWFAAPGSGVFRPERFERTWR
jgi:hypothetical protein